MILDVQEDIKSSTSLPGGNQVDGLPPAFSFFHENDEK